MRLQCAIARLPCFRLQFGACKDQYDPLRFQAVGQLWSANCTWARAEAPEGCKACEAAPIDMHSEACQKCLSRNKIFGYLWAIWIHWEYY